MVQTNGGLKKDLHRFSVMLLRIQNLSGERFDNISPA